MTSGDVATASALGRRTRTCRIRGPRAPYYLLGTMEIGSALLVAFFYAVSANVRAARPVEVPIFAALLVLAMLTAWVAPRLPGGLWLDVCIVGASIVSAGAVARVPEDEGQLTVGIGMLMLGMFTAYYRPTRIAVVDMVVAMALFLVATVVNPLLTTEFLALVFSAIVVVATAAFSVLVDELRDTALHDGLTGLLNRHGLSLLAPPVVAGARRAHADVTVCVVDLDRFKGYNDAHGHLAGDALLRSAADAWTTTARDSDLVVRWGGDEIVVILVGTSTTAAQDLAERALTAFETQRPEGWTHAWTTGSTQLGLEETVDDAIARADAQLLARKRARLPQQRPGDPSS